MTACFNCEHDKPGYRICDADRLRLKNWDESIRLICTSFELKKE